MDPCTSDEGGIESGNNEAILAIGTPFEAQPDGEHQEMRGWQVYSEESDSLQW